ncbi:MAG: protein NO VEIN domain-containing protein [Infirmifilum sp.]
MSAGRQGPSGSSTGSTRARALALIRKILEGFGSHPYFFIVRASGRASPPVEPYAHQVELLFRIAFRRPVRILVGDEIGLGKTVEAILAARMLVERDHASKVLILVPRILVKQWISELLRFGVRATELTRDNIEAKDAIWRAGSEIIDYIDKTERLGFANKHVEWVPRSIEQYQITSTYLGSIVYAGGRGGAGGAPPPAYVKGVEEAAMRAAMEYERKCGRIPEDVSMREHYDILSRDPRNGEVRYIEVKGRSGFDPEVELTEEEFKLAGKLGKRYWLYIVYGIGSGSPRILSI